MSEYIAFDSHKRYSLVEREDVATGKIVQQVRLTHAPGAVRRYLAQCAPGTAVALEATGNWYWIVEEIEQAGLQPRLVHPRKAKLMMGLINKTDKLDVHGLNRLQRNGTLPTVWIPPRPLRDLRELTRTRLVLVEQRTRLKNRLTATLAKYGVPPSEYSDAYGKSARAELEARIEPLLLADPARLLGQRFDPNWRRGSNRCPSRRAGSASSCWRRSIFWFGRFGSSSSGWRIWWRSRRRWSG